MNATSNGFVVRPCADSDRPALLALLRRVWPHKHDVERLVRERWWWRWDQPPVILVEDAQRPGPVGLCVYIPFPLRCGGRELACAWFVDFFILPEYQGKGLGQRLTQYVQDRFDLTASLSQTAMAYRVFQKMGWSERSRVTLYVHPLPWRGLFWTPSRGRRILGYPIDRALPVCADLDALWGRVRDAYGCLSVRSSERILDRYAGQGHRQYQLLCAYQKQACVGYMIVRAVHPMSGNAPPYYGLIVDYLVAPDDTATFSILLSHAVSHLASLGVRRMAILTTSPADARVLRRRAFLSPDTPLLGRALLANNKWLTYQARTDAPLVDPGGWFLTLGDCDIDYVWYQE